MAANRRLALLIDADNAQAALLSEILTKVSKYGTPTIRRIYGDWSEPNLKAWKELLHRYALQPQQQFSYTKGKNATDIALVIDTMDILHTSNVEGFCIVSSDSDYTPLVTRIREKGKFVLGVGKKNTPSAFVSACSAFVYTEELKQEQAPAATKPAAAAKPVAVVKPKAVPVSKTDARLEELFKSAFENAKLEEGWAHLGAFGSTLKSIDSKFDPRTYGHKQLSQLVFAHQDFLQVRKQKETDAIYVRLKTK